MSTERPSILHLLPSHRTLLDRHDARLVALMAIAVGAGLDPTEMAFVVADLASNFGVACLREGAGFEFLVTSDDGTETMVIPIGVDGLVILASMVPDAIEPVLTRQPGTIAIFLVDADDEPAIVLLEAGKLTGRSCS